MAFELRPGLWEEELTLQKGREPGQQDWKGEDRGGVQDLGLTHAAREGLT